VCPDDVEKALSADTKLAVFTHISNVAGTVNPVAQLGALCRAKGIPVLIDAAQSAGCAPIDVQAMNIDMIAFSGHKGLFGPQGTGGLYVREDIVLEPFAYGGTGSRSEELVMPCEIPDRYESGTPNTAGIAALGAGIRFVLETGVETIAAHEAHLACNLIEGLAHIPGVTVYGPPARSVRSGVVSFTVDCAETSGGRHCRETRHMEPQEIAAVLDSAFGIAVRAGLHCAPDAHRTLGTFERHGTVRASCGFFNTEDDVNALVGAVREIAESSGFGQS
jgi:selenocysteine lyase/cysteine desulfurase